MTPTEIDDAPFQHTGWSDEAVEAAAIAIAKIRMKDGMPPAIAAMVQFDEVFMQRWNGKTDVDLKQVAAYRADAIAALTAASSIAPATGFEVKALEWDGDFARTEFGLFYHVDRATGVPGLVILEKIEGSCTTKSAWPDIPSAEAHAQADFDRRIRSSISPSVAKESGEP